MSSYVSASVCIGELHPGCQINATDLENIHYYQHDFSLFITETAFNELIQLVQQSMREKKMVRPHREVE